MQTTCLKITGPNKMHCAGCESSVRFALSILPGVNRVDARWKSQEIIVDHALGVPLMELERALASIGYQVAPAPVER